DFMLMNSDGSILWVVNSGSNSISVYSVNSSTGALTEVADSPFHTISTIGGIAFSPDGKFLFVTNSNIASVSIFSVDGDGTLHALPGPPAAVGRTPLGLVMEPGGHFLYVANSTDNTVSILAFDSTAGTLTTSIGSPVPVGTTPQNL